MSFEQSKSDKGVVRSLINLKIEGTYLDGKTEITLFEEIYNNSRSYYFEMRSSENQRYVGKKVITSVEINELLHTVKGLNLPKNPERYHILDGAWIYLTIFNDYYEWMAPATPKGWESLEELVDRIEKLSDFEEFREECWKALKFEWLNVINLKKHHSYSLPKGIVVYKKNMEPAGLFYRIGDAREFVKMKDIWLELEWEPTNPYDHNAIKVMGCSRELHHGEKKHIGYIPRKLAKIIARFGLSNNLVSCLHRTYYDFRTNTVIVNFDLAGPVTKWKEFKEALQTAEYNYFL